MLNFGHTFGHALETMNNYNHKLNHGEAVAIGMSIASKISKNMGLLKDKEYKDILTHIKNVNLPIYDKRIKQNKFYDLILSDKKNLNNRINLILLEKIGKAFFKRNMTKENIKRILS